MAKHKYPMQYPDSDDFITSFGRVQVTLNCLHDYRDSLQNAYYHLVKARTTRLSMSAAPKAKAQYISDWYYSMMRMRASISMAKSKKHDFIEHLNSTHESPAIDPYIYFGIGAVVNNYPDEKRVKGGHHHG